MSSLKEIKNRITSVKATLKITSAMKLVASAKLRKAQAAIESMSPYQEALSRTLTGLTGSGASAAIAVEKSEEAVKGKTAVVAVSSNSSLCGGFNSNMSRKVNEVVSGCGGDVVLFALGRKMVDGLKRFNIKPEKDLSDLIAHPSYDSSAKFASELVERYRSGEFSSVLLVYTHFVSTARQVVTVEQYLPFEQKASGEVSGDEDYLVEPGAAEVVKDLLPKVLSLKIYAMILDSAAAEHAARTVAMQTATDNGNDILSELTIKYNKGRQNKITTEILDLVSGSANE